ncbi:universal stress protein [Ascidiimonas sp. W6]|uniref:universal stress protein n=1 Tax=Ascidiimonas meishanensis TaxID=3128903 RepID=UPI0030EC4388
MKRILLPTDFSDNALNAIKYALYLFEKEDCVFYLLNAYQVSPSPLSSKINQERHTRLFEITEEESIYKMKKLRTALENKNLSSNHRIKTYCKPGNLVQIIFHFTTSKKIDYIFMGTKGSTAAKEIFMGSSTVAVIKNIDYCSVVAVPGKYVYDLPDEILFATDFKRYFEKAEIKPLKDIALLWNTTLRILHINMGTLNTAQKKNKFILEQLLVGIPFIEEELLNHKGSIAKAIMKYANQKYIGMVAMVNNKHSFIEKQLREAVVKKVAFKTDVPFLVLPEIQE